MRRSWQAKERCAQRCKPIPGPQAPEVLVRASWRNICIGMSLSATRNLSSAPNAAVWFFAQDRKTKLGPYDWEGLQRLAARGVLKPTDMVIQQGDLKWVEAHSVPNLFVGRLQQFLTELAQNHEQILKAADFLEELSGHFDRRRRKIANRRSSFLVDLAATYGVVAKINPEQYLMGLGTYFENCRNKTRRRIAEILMNISDEDPIKCPISLFETMRFHRVEVAHTRALAWLLNPNKQHGFGSILFDAIWEHLSGEPITEMPFMEDVDSEKRIELNGKYAGRLDIFLRGRFLGAQGQSPWVLCIEAKIDAHEGARQLPRYDEWLESSFHDREIRRVFLTPQGAPPEQSSKWEAMSFAQLARILRSRLEKVMNAPGYHYLRFYLTAVMKDICRWSLPISDANKVSDPYRMLEYLSSIQPSA
jgi:PD-(D/E)XK nuclease superfamily protein/uncharacterized protein DUF4339